MYNRFIIVVRNAVGDNSDIALRQARARGIYLALVNEGFITLCLALKARPEHGAHMGIAQYQ